MKSTVQFAALALLAIIAMTAVSCGGNANKKQAADTATETKAEAETEAPKAKGGAVWANNEYTALIPKLSTGTVYAEKPFDNAMARGYGIDMVEWSVKDCKAYAEQLKQAGFTTPGYGFDNVVVKDTPSEYSFIARNGKGVSVSVGYNAEHGVGRISIQTVI